MTDDRPKPSAAAYPNGGSSPFNASQNAGVDATVAATPPRQGYRLISLIIASALFMENLDATVLATALPTMARDFGVHPAELSVTVTAYLLALAVFVPVSGFMCDRFGARNVFGGAIVTFMAGSAACAISPTLETIAIARFVQGIGGAMMVPVGRLVMLRTVPKRDFVAAQAWLLMPGLIGTIAGPPVGGFVVTYFDWRWIFWINLPTGLCGLLLVWVNIPNFKQEGRRRFDTLGFLLSGIALGALILVSNLPGQAAKATSVGR